MMRDAEQRGGNRPRFERTKLVRDPPRVFRPGERSPEITDSLVKDVQASQDLQFMIGVTQLGSEREAPPKSAFRGAAVPACQHQAGSQRTLQFELDGIATMLFSHDGDCALAPPATFVQQSQ